MDEAKYIEAVAERSSAIRALREENAALKAQIARLTAPVSDEEWGMRVMFKHESEWAWRKGFDNLIAARASAEKEQG